MMREIDDIVELYEAVSKSVNPYGRYYYLIMEGKFLGTVAAYIISDNKKYTKENLGKYLEFSDKAIIEYEMFNKEWVNVQARPFQGNHFSFESMSLVANITKEEMYDIVDQNIVTFEGFKKYKAAKTIKDTNSTMMDVLCAFGDL